MYFTVLQFVSMIVISIIVGIVSTKLNIRLSKKTLQSIIKVSSASGLFAIIFISLGLLVFSYNKIYSEENQSGVKVYKSPESSYGLAFLASALSVGIGSLGAGIAVGMSASAALGALSENPKIFGNAIVLVGLAEGVAIYGLIIAILILNKL